MHVHVHLCVRLSRCAICVRASSLRVLVQACVCLFKLVCTRVSCTAMRLLCMNALRSYDLFGKDITQKKDQIDFCEASDTDSINIHDLMK